MKILALDCATEACSVALYQRESNKTSDEGQLLAEEYQLAPREHTQLLLPLVERVLAQSQTALKDLDAIAFGRGPGSFTGLRIVLGAVQGLAFGADLPVIPVSSLATLAELARQEAPFELASKERIINERIVAAIDARMGEVYWAEYQLLEGELLLEGKERLSTPDELYKYTHPHHTHADSPWVGVGSGWGVVTEAFDTRADRLWPEGLPRASILARLAFAAWQRGEAVSAEQASPVYLREQVAWQKTG